MSYIPAIRERIDKELNTINQTFEQQALERTKDAPPFVVRLPAKGLDSKEILEKVTQCVKLGKRTKHIHQY